MRNQKTMVLVGVLAVAAFGLPIAWYLGSPLFITRAVNEPLPGALPTEAMAATDALLGTPTVDSGMLATEETMMASTDDAMSAATADAMLRSTQTMLAVEATADMETAMVMPTEMVDEPMPTEAPPEPVVLAQGDFYNVVHEGEGTATIFELPDGARILRLDEFTVLNGPDLHVYLAPIDPVPYAVGVEIEGSVDLGKLKGNVGSQNYELPADLDLSLYKSVVIWCQPFRVPFIAAGLR